MFESTIQANHSNCYFILYYVFFYIFYILHLSFQSASTPPGEDSDPHRDNIDKWMRGTTDPVVAATKFRKQTLKMYNQIAEKVQSSIQICKSAMEEISEDFASEVP